MESLTSNLTSQINCFGDYQLRYSRPGIYVRSKYNDLLLPNIVNFFYFYNK